MLPFTVVLRAVLMHLRRQPWQGVLSILGVALGVAVIVAIDTARDSARQAHASDARAAAGAATHRLVGGPRGIAESLYRMLRVDLGIRGAVPRLQGELPVAPEHGGTTVLLTGIDPLASTPIGGATVAHFSARRASERRRLLELLFVSDGVLLDARLAERLAIAQGQYLQVLGAAGSAALKVLEVMRADDPALAHFLRDRVIADIALAQELLGRVGWLDSIDLVLSAGQVAKVRAALPPGVLLEPIAAPLERARRLTRAFDTNVDMLGILALLVGLLLVYNTMTFSVVQRRHHFGVLRSLGVTRRELVLAVAVEAGAIGLVGGAFGIVLGLELAERLSVLMERTISDLYYTARSGQLSVAGATLVKAWLLALAGSMLAAAGPALEAARTTASAALRRSTLEEQSRRLTPRLAAAGLFMIGVGLVLLALPGRGLAVAFTSLFIIVLGAVLVVPLALVGLVEGAAWISEKTLTPLVTLSVRAVNGALTRTAVAVAALTIALSTAVGVGVMVQSFRTSVAGWLEYTLRADAYLSMPGSGQRSTVDARVLAALEAHPGVAAVSLGRGASVRARHGPVALVALRMAPRSYGGFNLLAGEQAPAWRAFARGAVLVSEPYAYRHQVEVGDAVALLTARGWRDFKVAAVYRDYGSEHGAILMDMSVYRQAFEDRTVGSVGIYLAQEADLAAVSERLRAVDGRLRIRESGALRALSLAIFDRTFLITRVLEALTVIIAFIGVLSALMALQLERGRELGLLRAMGVTRLQGALTVFCQTGTMGLAAGLFALPIGAGVGFLLVHVINRRAFGWSMELSVPAALVPQIVALSVAAALLAGIYPALKMARRAPADDLRGE
ncbi:MAG: FtsX-like permease family protein [Gammaproteobacteria bacterium]|nr:FtsX-like permease family protein [Gammaproteobacteria bacterium]